MRDYSTIFPSLDADSKIWVYVAPKSLDEKTALELRSVIDSFGQNWSSHGRVVHSGFELLENRVAILSAQVQQGDISGCGIDKSLHVLDQFAVHKGFNWVEALSVIYRDDSDKLLVVSRPEFRALVKANRVSDTTIVLDPSITTLGPLRSGGLELPAGSSWHARVFGITSSMSV